MFVKKKKSFTVLLVILLTATVAFAANGIFCARSLSVAAAGTGAYDGQVLFWELNGSELVIAGNSTDFDDGGGNSIAFKDTAFDGNREGDDNAHWHAADKKDTIEKVTLISGYPTSMYRWFARLSNLTTVCFEGSFSSYKCEDLSGMFSGCTSLRKIDLSGFNFSAAKKLEGVFRNCNALTEITWGVSKPTSNATAFYGMFYSCTALETVDLSGFDMSGAYNPKQTIYMFQYCPNIKTIVAPQALPNGYNIDLEGKTFWNGEDNVTTIASGSLGKTLKLHNDHDYKDIAAKAATCTEDGVIAHKVCTVCGKNFDANGNLITSSVVIPKLGHSYGEWKVTKPATCTEKGEETRVCAHNSAHTETREVSALGHTVVTDAAKAATCTETGLTEGSHCSVCSAVLVAQQTIKAKGHTVGTAATCTSKAVCATCHQEYGEPLGHDYTSLVIVESPREQKYRAFQRFLTSTVVVNAGCGRSGCGHKKEVESTDYTVTYTNGDCLHVGDTSVAIRYAVAPNKTLTATVEGIKVEATTRVIAWQYNPTPDDPNSWKQITADTEFTYDPDSRYAVRATFTDGKGNTRTFREFNEHVSFETDGKTATSIGNAGEYEFTLDTAATLFPDYSATDYMFVGKTAGFTIHRAPIELNDTDNFYWLLQIDDTATSALRDGYIRLITDESGAYYYKYFGEAGADRISVIRSIVRDRNKAVTVKLYGARAADDDYTIAYGENGELGNGGYTQSGSGKYTAYAVLTIVNNNYEFIKTGELAAERHMTVTIGDDGSVLISKEWYIAKIDNGLRSQQTGNTYGKEWNMSGWTYGNATNNYAPRLEHGDPGAYGGTIAFDADNELVTFELFKVETTGTVNRVKLGETFNRHAFYDYINASVPVGRYVLVVHAGSYTSIEHEHWFENTSHDGAAAGIFYDGFTREFHFTVTPATLSGNAVDLNGKTFAYDYDGALHLFDNTFNLNAPVHGREGIWVNAEYNDYYGNAALYYNLTRWSDPDTYIGIMELNAMQNASNKPVNADTYTVRFIVRAPNYADTACGCSFTVKINKAEVQVPDNVTDTLMKTYVFSVPENAKYSVKSGVVTTFTQTGTHTVVLKLNDSENYTWADGDSVDGDEATISVTLVLHDHDFGDWHAEVSATCTATGTKGYRDCSICEKHFDVSGAEITDLTIAALGHDYGAWTVSKAATVNEFGEQERVCAHDGTHTETRQTPKRVPQLAKPGENGETDEVIVSAPDGFAHDTELVVAQIAQENFGDYEAIAQTANGEIGFVYNVTLQRGGVNVQPDGTLTVKLSIPAKLRGKSFTLFHLHNGEATETKYTVDGSYAVVTTDRLSEFVFVGAKPASERAGNTLWLIPIILVSLVIVCEVGWIAYRKVRKNKATAVK